MNCYKLAQNQDFEDCLAGAMAALLAIAIADTAGKRLSSMPAAPPPPSSSGAAAAVAEEKWATADVGRFLTALKAQLVYWAPLLSKLTQGEEANEEALVLAVEQRLSTSTSGSGGGGGKKSKAKSQFRVDEAEAARQFPRVLQMLYGDGESGVVSEEGILRWAANKRLEQTQQQEAGEGEDMTLFELKGTHDFLEWLEASEEEDSEDEDADDDEDSDE